MSLQWTRLRTVSEMGRTRVELQCPCCGLVQWGFLWSLAGGGKRCENEACRAKFRLAEQGCTPNKLQPPPGGVAPPTRGADDPSPVNRRLPRPPAAPPVQEAPAPPAPEGERRVLARYDPLRHGLFAPLFRASARDREAARRWYGQPEEEGTDPPGEGA